MTTAEPNGQRRAWLGAQLEHAAGAFGVTISVPPVFGWHDRTIGTQVSTADGEPWLWGTPDLTPTYSLDSPSGQVAQLAAILKLLCLIEDGEHLDIAAPLHRHARTLIAHL